MKIALKTNERKINNIGITKDTLSERGGLSFINRYIDSLGLFEKIEKRFGHLRKSSKGKDISEIVRQIMAFCMDGSSHALSRFDELKKDPGYASVLERSMDELISTAMAKRFFAKFNGTIYMGFRSILNDMFVWRLKEEKPDHIVLHLDTMVLNNDDAKKREGVKPTYKDVCGFQPLQINWGPYIIDMHFRSGEKHSNHGNDAREAVARVVRLIRNQYSKNIPIILSADSGFLSEENLEYFEERLKISYIVTGKLYQSIYSTFEEQKNCASDTIAGEHASWVCYDFKSKLDSWKKNRRTILSSMVSNDDQYIMQGIRDSVMYTNLGNNELLDSEFIKLQHENLLSINGIVKLAHRNGEEELNHRSIKDFMGSEHLPFNRFGMNGAYYTIMVMSHFLMEAFRKDVLVGILPNRCYPTTLRRQIIDIAVKFVKSSRNIIMKATQAVSDRISIETIWLRCNCQPVFD